MSNIIELTDQNFEETVLKKKGFSERKLFERKKLFREKKRCF